MKDNRLTNYVKGFADEVAKQNVKKPYWLALQIINEFAEYIDMLAAANPQRFHHIYEWGYCGDEAGRLFELVADPAMNNRVVIQYNFRESVVPNMNGQIFWNKAEVMESGMTIISDPSTPVLLRDGNWRIGPFTLVPGGMDTNGAFRDAFVDYFNTVLIVGPKPIKPSVMSLSGGRTDARRIYGSIIAQ